RLVLAVHLLFLDCPPWYCRVFLDARDQRTKDERYQRVPGRCVASNPPPAPPRCFFSGLYAVFSRLRLSDLLSALLGAHPGDLDRHRGTSLYLFFRRRDDYIVPGGAACRG